MTDEPEQLYSLFHVNIRTGECVRYPLDAFPSLPRAQAEQWARDSRQAKVLASAFHSEWETQALPESPES